MAHLHLISTLNASDLTEQISRYTQPGDKLLFIADSVIQLLKPEIVQSITTTKLEVYVLKNDLACRGITHNISDIIVQIDELTMVELSCTCDKIISW
ncbi:sulfurtransferase complex subunit TusB [Aliikangiella sp. IMCC44359]|uniref:sulfurtransferase complex subunit TusB n=1 Tax=Aliikangiella sp. IMCC44359 TaxID=3459125 RepID=UPI00403AFEC6